MDSTTELIFVPAAGAGHLVSALELAKLLVARDCRLSVTVLLIKIPFEYARNASAESLSSTSSERIKFVDLPKHDHPADSTPQAFVRTFYASQKANVRDAVAKIESGPGSPRLAGFVLDMFCMAMMDVASEFGVPAYVFFTSGAGMLCLLKRFRDLIDDDEDRKITEFGDELVVPGFASPIPRTAMPSVFLTKESVPLVCDLSSSIAKASGVLVNTFEELESSMIKALSNNFPPVYPVGPIISHSPVENSHGEANKKAEIIEWLDRQPRSSVVFLCFGSMGSFGGDQVREIAVALENTGVRFLWSLRRPPQKDKFPNSPSEYEDPAEVLPEGFIERTVGLGKVIGWAPQVAVLAHPAVGGFVSHCGWNSTLESIWLGVPVATWPLYAEQQLNAHQLVRESGLAVEISLDYRKDRVSEGNSSESQDLIVKAEKIERGIVELMELESDTRKRVKEMSEKSRKALLDGGSSYTSLSRFIHEVIGFVA